MEFQVLTALEVQKMIAVEDYDFVAHGYTFERNTLDIWFEKGNIVRQEYKPDGYGANHIVNETGEVDFRIEFFFSDVKRWYEDSFNKELLKLICTFSQYAPPLLRRTKS